MSLEFAEECDEIQEGLRIKDGSGSLYEALGVAINERKRRESNSAFLLDIGDDFARLSSPPEIMHAVGEKMARYFAVSSRLSLSELDKEKNKITVSYDYPAPGMVNALGSGTLLEYIGEDLLREMEADRIIAVNDMSTDPRTAGQAEAYIPLGVRSELLAPYVFEGRVVFVISVQHREPHFWREDEIDLLQELASRIYRGLERLRIEDALLQSRVELERQQRFFDAMLSNTVDFVCAFNRNMQFVYANQPLKKMWGVTGNEYAGKTFAELGYDHGMCELLLTQIERVFETKEVIADEMEFTCLSGRYGYWTHILSPVIGCDGSVEFVVGVSRDTTERKQAEERLRASEERLRLATEAADMYGWEIDLTKDTFKCSANPKNVVCSPLPKTFSEVFESIHHEDRDKVKIILEHAIKNFEEFEFEYRRGNRLSGDEAWAYTAGVVIADENRLATRVVGVTKNITERKRAEEELRKAKSELEERVQERTHELVQINRQLVIQGEVLQKSEARAYQQMSELESIYQSVPVGLCVFDRNLRYVHINARFAEMTGVPVADHIGRTPREIVPGLADQTEAFLHQILETGQPVLNVEFIGTTPLKPGVLRTWIGNLLPLQDDEGRISGINVVFEEITERKHAQQELEKAYEEIKKLNEQLAAENIYLREKVEATDAMGDIIGTSHAIRYVMDRIKQVAQTDATVLLTGETGTGKGLFARALHEMSHRKDKPFVHVNCAGLPPNLIESELFGREKGAFTGSTARQIGRFELAQGGTIFLDEIGEIPLELQAKLLKVIEDGELERLGSPHPIKVDVRIIASTNRNFEKEIEKGRFRMDLFYRLNVFPITIPPLRQRKEDILILVNFFVEKFAKKHRKNITKISQNTIKALESYDWPGNVRELMHVIERALIVSDGPILSSVENIEILPNHPCKEQMLRNINVPEPKGMADIEREHILRTLLV